MSNNLCLTEQELLEKVFGDEDIENFKGHVSECSICQKRIEKVKSEFARLEFFAPNGGERAFNAAVSFLGLQTSLPIERTGQTGEILTIKEVADYLKLDVENVRRILPILAHFRIDGHIRVRRAALNEFIENQEKLAKQSFQATMYELSLKHKF